MTRSEKEKKEAPIFTAFYEIVGWILQAVEKFPKSQRFVFGQPLANRAVDTLELIVQALYARNKLELLRQAGLSVEVLRILTRLCRDRSLITSRQHVYISGKLAEVGAMVGGWIKQQRRR